MADLAAMKCYVTLNTRVYCDMGSVFLKMVVANGEFTGFAFNPEKGRIQAVTIKVIPAGEGDLVRVTTDKGPYEVAKSQAFRGQDGTPIAVEDLKPGTPLHSGILENNNGFIFAKTAGALVALHELMEVDLFGGAFNLTRFQAEVQHPAQLVLKVEELGKGSLYELQVTNSGTKDDMTKASGHNVFLWPDGTSFGAGVFIY
ncbi:MAG: hypothetical protein V4507_14000 [Verrucomicrobiota bacterium]